MSFCRYYVPTTSIYALTAQRCPDGELALVLELGTGQIRHFTIHLLWPAFRMALSGAC